MTVDQPRLDKLERDVIRLDEELHGPADERRREHMPGLAGQLDMVHHEVRQLRSDVGVLRASRNEAAALAAAKRWFAGFAVTVLGLLLTLIGLMLRVAQL